ncbi:MAG: hypothetical protein GY950_36020 [bacterium]|nr:hypothetical protein [bacterium]
MKKFIVKLIFLLPVIFLMQSLLTHYLLKIESPGLDKYVLRFNEFTRLNRYLKRKTNVIYFGDSTVDATAKDDNDRRSISEMLGDLHPRRSLETIKHAAYHAGLYREFCKYIARQSSRPAVIIIPINMRSFSPEWDRRPQYQFEIEKIILRGGLLKQLLLAFYKPLRVFGYNFYTISAEEFSKTPVFNGTRQAGIVKDFNNKEYVRFSEKNMKKKILFFYMYTLSPNHRKLKALVETTDVLKKNNIKCIFYITPIDWETGERYFPGEFSGRLRQNTRLVQRLLAEKGIEVLDLSTDLTADFFYWRLYPNEHLNQRGRMYVAHHVSRVLSAIR